MGVMAELILEAGTLLQVILIAGLFSEVGTLLQVIQIAAEGWRKNRLGGN